jgi:hypothetical protein
MTVADFRKMALSFPDTEERAHQGHPDFRVGGKIFATLAYPEKDWGMVKLTPEQQQTFVDVDAAFTPVKGGWGLQGATSVQLKSARKSVVRNALEIAWQNASRPKTKK